MALIDRYIPSPHFSERHSLRVRAPAEVVLAAAGAYRAETDPFFRRMIALRELPARLGHSVRSRKANASPPFGIDNFTVLERGACEIVYGLAGRFWRSDFDLACLTDGRDFLELDEPGIAKLALNFAVRADIDGVSILSTETRIFCVDAAARVRFTPYWYLIRPVSGLIRQRTLTSIRRASEAPRLEIAA